MIASERHILIMQKLNHRGVVTVKEIASELNISEITVRRDFEQLEQKGMLQRVAGGATAGTTLENAELTMYERLGLNAQEKVRVAEQAVSYVKDGSCVFIDGGTSMAPLMRQLSRRRITIVSYNVLLVRDLAHSDAEIFLVGGKFLPHYSMNVGPIAQECLKQFHFDVGFFGCSGLDFESEMSFTTNIDSLLMKQIALANASFRALLVDASKLNRCAFLEFAPLNSFDAILCNKTALTGNPPASLILV